MIHTDAVMVGPTQPVAGRNCPAVAAISAVDGIGITVLVWYLLKSKIKNKLPLL